MDIFMSEYSVGFVFGMATVGLLLLLWAKEQEREAFGKGYSFGKADLNREVLRAENKAFLNGYEKAKKELHPFVPHGPKTPNNTTKSPAKPLATKKAPRPKKPAKKTNPMPNPKPQTRSPQKAVKGK